MRRVRFDVGESPGDGMLNDAQVQMFGGQESGGGELDVAERLRSTARLEADGYPTRFLDQIGFAQWAQLVHAKSERLIGRSRVLSDRESTFQFCEKAIPRFPSGAWPFIHSFGFNLRGRNFRLRKCLQGEFVAE